MESALLSIYEAKTHLSSYVQRVAAGESFVITSHGKPMAQISPVSQAPSMDDTQARKLAAIERMKARLANSTTPRVSAQEWKEWVNEGRGTQWR